MPYVAPLINESPCQYVQFSSPDPYSWVHGFIDVTYNHMQKKQVRMWDNQEYKWVIPGSPTRARRVSLGRPGITSEYSWLSHI